MNGPLEDDVLEGCDEGAGPWSINPSFPEVPVEVLEKSEWAVLVRRERFKTDSILLLEARARVRC